MPLSQGRTFQPLVLNFSGGGPKFFDDDEWGTISEDAKTLIKHVLTKKVSERATLSQALNHDWVKNLAPRSDNHSLAPNLVNSLQTYHGHSFLKKAALHVIAANLRESQIESLRETFKAMDDNGDGMLSTEELMTGIDGAGVTGVTADDVKRIMNSLDEDGSGFIDYTEFLAAALDARMYEEREVLSEAFAVFDRDGDGTITKEELKAVLSDGSLDCVISKNIDSLLADIDQNGDGSIDFEEFVTMMTQPAGTEQQLGHL